jgi:hypothetical protein
LAPLVALLLAASLSLTGCDLLAGGTPVEPDEPTDSDAVAVSLSWGEDVDLDLEIWDEDGEEYLASAWWYDSDDVTDGSDNETFDFTDQEGRDFGESTYTVSVLYADRDSGVDIPEVPVTLTVEDASGEREIVSGTVYWDADRVQWHAFRIGAQTGEIVDVDEHVAATAAD